MANATLGAPGLLVKDGKRMAQPRARGSSHPRRSNAAPITECWIASVGVEAVRFRPDWTAARFTGMRSRVPLHWSLLLLLPAVALRAAPAQLPPPPDSVALVGYEPVRRQIGALIEDQMREKRLPALAIAIVEDQRIVWARGFGGATARTVFRVGSVSKLFTDLAVMRLVERKSLELDAPVTKYLPAFTPRNPFPARVTLRALMTHRSGLVREPPVGHYFDSTSPPLDTTVASLNRTAIVYAPGTRTKYSNAGIAVVGRVLEVTQKTPFARYLQETLLDPLGMRESSFDPDSTLLSRVPPAEMWTLDGRRFEAPRFGLGMAPAGSLYATVTDLGRFLSFLFAGGRTATGDQIIRKSTLDSMWTVQYEPAATTGYGIGFALSRLDGERRVGHNGGIYGFSTHVSALPDQRIGVIVVTTVDDAGAVVSRIGTEALRALLAQRSGRTAAYARSSPTDSALARALAGRYTAARPRRTRVAGGASRGAARAPAQPAPALDLVARGDSLTAWRMASARPELLRRAGGDTLIADGRLAYGRRYVISGKRLIVGGDTLLRVTMPRPAPARTAVTAYIGEYGPDFDVQYVLEQEGWLYLLVEWFDWYPLEPSGRDAFLLPDEGGYAGERVVFLRDSRGRVTTMMFGGVALPRRTVGPTDGNQLRIIPRRPAAEVLAEAKAAEPPADTAARATPDLVDVTTVEPGIRLDIRYATANNFLGVPFYSSARAFLQRPAAEALARAHRALRAAGYGLLIHDAYRPWYVTKAFWDATPDSLRWLVADPATGSRHNRGAAVDITLFYLATGKPVEMPGTYDEATPRSLPEYPGGTARQRWHRELLRRTMEAAGFTVNASEWWHFDHRDWPKYGVLNVFFDDIR